MNCWVLKILLYNGEMKHSTQTIMYSSNITDVIIYNYIHKSWHARIPTLSVTGIIINIVERTFSTGFQNGRKKLITSYVLIADRCALDFHNGIMTGCHCSAHFNNELLLWLTDCTVNFVQYRSVFLILRTSDCSEYILW